jgi:DNA-binding transcriptional regulator GbsR (MarR family)
MAMTDYAEQPDMMRYIEQWGMLFEQLGATRVMGKILGWLLVCEPPHQTAAEIAHAIGASMSSVSTATRALAQSAFVERIGMPGERSAHFQVRPGMWSQLIRTRMARLGAMRELAEEGMRLLPSANKEQTRRLREVRSYCDFIDKELPALLARWEGQWEEECR